MLANGTIEFSLITEPKPYVSWNENVIMASNDQFFALGNTDGRLSIKQLIDKAQKKTLDKSPQWGKENFERLLSGKDIDEKEKRKRVASIPELEALLYLWMSLSNMRWPL